MKHTHAYETKSSIPHAYETKSSTTHAYETNQTQLMLMSQNRHLSTTPVRIMFWGQKFK